MGHVGRIPSGYSDRANDELRTLKVPPTLREKEKDLAEGGHGERLMLMREKTPTENTIS
tara:strand:+ start:582 stop:758 length:177 start_codon:yes stop_codon:yes gene_type:complete